MAVLSRRWATAIILAILTIVGVVASVSGFWTHHVLFDTETWVETVGPIGTDEVVTAALADRFSTEITDWFDAENRLEGLLPPILAPLAGWGAGFINDAVVDETQRFFESELYANTWLEVNETAHAGAVAVIRDELPNVSTEDGAVTVDLIPILTPIVDRVLARITEFGQDVPEVLLNQVDIDETVAGIISTYEEEGLPERLGAVEVFRSTRLAAVQDTTALLDRMVWVLPILTIVLGAAAVYLAPARWRMGAALLGAAALGWFLAWLSVELLVNSIVSGIDSDTAAAVAAEVFIGVTAGLDSLLSTLVVVAAMGCAGVLAWDWHSDREVEGEEPEKMGPPR